MPNVTVNFRVPTFFLRVTARREIKAGNSRRTALYANAMPASTPRLRATGYEKKWTTGFESSSTSEAKRLQTRGSTFNIRSLDPLLKLKDIIKEGWTCLSTCSIILQASRKISIIEYYNKYAGDKWKVL